MEREDFVVDDLDERYIRLGIEQDVPGRKNFTNGVDIESGQRDDALKIKNNEQHLLWEFHNDGHLYGHDGTGTNTKTIKLNAIQNSIQTNYLTALSWLKPLMLKQLFSQQIVLVPRVELLMVN